MLTSPRPIYESLIENVAITVDPVTLREAVMKDALWKRLKSVEVRLCNDKGKVVQKGVTELQFRQQDWSRLRVGLWDDHNVWISEPAVVKSANKPGRRISDKKAYSWLEDRFQNDGWTFDDGAVHDELGVRLGPARLHRTIKEALSDSNGNLKPGITLPKDHKTPVGWAKKISGLDQE